MIGLNSARLWRATRISQRRQMSEMPAQAPKKMDGVGEDVRPPWVYITSRIMSLALIPGVSLYSIFFYDFGDREHVFQPIRRWGRGLTAGFFTLSPEEERIVDEQHLLESTSTTDTMT